MADKIKSLFTKRWILDNGIPIVQSYGGNLTIRALHYRLVADFGMTNDQAHYKKVVDAMGDARWNEDLGFDAFKDHERETLGETKYDQTKVPDAVENAVNSIKFWANYYRKNRWENQPIYPEVFIEKKALQGVFEATCNKWNIALSPCKGYPSITFLYDAKQRFEAAADEGKIPTILYFGDYDCSGEDIPRSIVENLGKMGIEVDLRRIALTEKQVVAWKLPPAPTKETDSRGNSWDGKGQVELDAVRPEKIRDLLTDAIKTVFDEDLYNELTDEEETEKKEYKAKMKVEVNNMFDKETDTDEDGDSFDEYE
jgi:hypothetical protein